MQARGWEANSMEISITTRHYEISHDLKRHLTEKLKKLDRYSVRMPEVHMTLSREKYREVAEVVAHVNRTRLSASDESDDMYRSVDRVIEKLERKLREYKEKSNRAKGRPGNSKRERSGVAYGDGQETA
jgi:putative sigma-54 modulation protein